MGRQIVLQFDRPVVPLGRMQRETSEVPVRITPDPGCEWRWLDRSALACQLSEERPLAPATRYRVVVRPGIRAEDGATLRAPFEHAFLTERPAVGHTWFETWRSPGTPRARVTFNQPVTGESVRAALSFETRGASPTPTDVQPVDDRHVSWFVEPARELPADREVALRVAPGVRSRDGSEPGVESRDVVTFRTFPEPRFLGIECRSLDGVRIRVDAGLDESTASRCDPLTGVALLFTTPIVKDVLARHLRITPDLAGGRTDYDPWDNVPSYSQLGGIRQEHRYRVYLPEVLRADDEYRIEAHASSLRDEFDRPLAADIDFRFWTDHRRPDLRLGHPASVLEAGVETHLPVVVTNLERIDARFDALTARGIERNVTRQTRPQRAQDVAFHAPLPVREWLPEGSGALVGHLTGEPVAGARPLWFFSVVTPFQVHVKLGHYNTLVWVTDLETGQPVAGATVDVFSMPLERFDDEIVSLDRAATDADGLATLSGADALDPDRSLAAYWQRRDEPHLYVRVQQGPRLGVMPLGREFRLRNLGPGETWVATRLESRHGHLVTWGTTAQGIYRAGDTVQYKIWVRQDGNERLEPAPRSGYTLRLHDPTGKQVLERTGISLNDFGALDGELEIPESGAVGWYRFELGSDLAPADRSWTPLSVLISDFTPAPFRVTPTLDAERYRVGDRVRVDTVARLHSGGPYVDAQTRVTARLRALGFETDDPRARGFHFDTGFGVTETLHQSDADLDGQGELITTFDAISEGVLYGALIVESAVRDDRGKSIGGTARARFAARDRFLGLRQDDWVLKVGEQAEVRAVVTDADGKLTAGTPVEFRVERRVTRASRVKGAGNAYLTHYIHDWEHETTCTAPSADEAIACSFTPTHPGVVRVTATLTDTRGRTLSGSLQRWVAGRGAVLWEQPPGHHLQVYPEKDTLRVGEQARYLIKNPFPGAEALVTVERNGVLRRWVETLEDSTAIVEFEVTPDDLPGFYLSVVVTSPRVDAAPSDDGVDLGKPSFRMGYARTIVRDSHKELSVEVVPRAATYKPRQRVTVDLRATTRQGEVRPIELAVAVLDEAVLDLLKDGAEHFDPYAGFYRLAPLDLANFNLLKNLVGFRKFEQKGADPGGGGGGDARMRSRFEFVSYWNPSLPTGPDGRATIEFELPDNLTGWRVLAMAATPGDAMGLGQGSFVVTQPTEIRPALPNRVIEGDRFTATFSVINRTESTRTLTVTAGAEGHVEGQPFLATTVEAEPFKRKLVELPIAAGAAGELRIRVRAGDDVDADALERRLPVGRLQALVAAATYGTTTEDTARERLLFPPGIRTDVGRVSVVASPSVIGGLEGAFEYLRDYPYACWEQRLTKGVMAAHYRRLSAWLPDSLTWEESAELPERTLLAAANFQAPSGGMAYYRPEDRYVSPYLSAYTALAFRWLANQGYAVPAGVEGRLHDYLDALLRRDAFPTFYSKGMASTVRAVALAALAQAGKIDRADLARYREHVPRMDLFGKAHFLQALQAVDGTAPLRREVEQLILAHAEETGGKLKFVETLDDGYTRILHTGLRTDCSILTALVAQGPSALQAAGAGALPMKLVRAITQARKQSDRWENTQENLFCMNALVDYASAYESEAPDFVVDVELDGARIGRGRLDDVRDEPLELERPIGEDDPGREAELVIRRRGVGRLYYAARMFYSPATLERRRIHSGIEVRREYSAKRSGHWIRLEEPMRVQRGELVRVDLYVTVPVDRNFVVVDDPLPGGLEPVNRDLATSSAVDADEAVFEFPRDAWYRRYDDWRHFGVTRWSFYHQELRHSSARFYSEYLPAGRYHLSYVAQVIAKGTFQVPPLHAEEMYDPDVYGQGLPGMLIVEEPTP